MVARSPIVENEVGEKVAATPVWSVSPDGVAVPPAGTDANGDPLPANFDSLPRDTSDRDAEKNLLSESRTDGVTTWTQTYTRDADGDITLTSEWVPS